MDTHSVKWTVVFLIFLLQGYADAASGYTLDQLRQQKSYKEIIKMIRDHPLPPAERDGATLLHVLADFNVPYPLAIKAVQLALEKGALTDACDDRGRTPLYKAASHDSGMFDALLEAGANPWIANKCGRTPLRVVAELEEQFLARISDLYAAASFRGMYLDDPSSDGVTPLMGAATCLNVFSINMLVGLGANVNQQCSNGYTAFAYLMRNAVHSNAAYPKDVEKEAKIKEKIIEAAQPLLRQGATLSTRDKIYFMYKELRGIEFYALMELAGYLPLPGQIRSSDEVKRRMKEEIEGVGDIFDDVPSEESIALSVKRRRHSVGGDRTEMKKAVRQAWRHYYVQSMKDQGFLNKKTSVWPGRRKK